MQRIVELDSALGAGIFFNTPPAGISLSHDEIVSFLETDCASVEASLAYMHHIVVTKKSKMSEYHDKLAMMFIQALVARKEDALGEHVKVFHKLVAEAAGASIQSGAHTLSFKTFLLKRSGHDATAKLRLSSLEYLSSEDSLYDAPPILERLKLNCADSSEETMYLFCLEMAAVLEHEGEFERVLEVMIRNARDVAGAEEFAQKIQRKHGVNLLKYLVELAVASEFGYVGLWPHSLLQTLQ